MEKVKKSKLKRKIHYPFKWIQLNGNWIVYFEKFDNSHLFRFNCRKVGYALPSSNFFLLLSLISHSRARFEHVLFRNIHQKWKYY